MTPRFRAAAALSRHVLLMLLFAAAGTQDALAGAPLALKDEAGQPAIRVTVNLVPVHVTVTDAKGRPVTGLHRSDFRIYEDNVEQVIASFDAQNTPVSWSLVIDRSGSMERTLGDLRATALELLDSVSAADEIVLLPFHQTVEPVYASGPDRAVLRQAIAALNASGGTALYDSIASALESSGTARIRKTVIVLLTDGQDENSRIDFHELLKRAEENPDVLIYPVGLFDSSHRPWWDRTKSRQQIEIERNLKKLAEVSGTVAYFPTSRKECLQAITAISRNVRQQYSLAYYGASSEPDGRWHAIQVTLDPAVVKDRGVVVRSRKGRN